MDDWTSDMIVRICGGIFAAFVVLVLSVILIYHLKDCFNVCRGKLDPSAIAPVLMGASARNRQRQQQPSTNEAVRHDTHRTRRRRRRLNSRDGTTTSDDTDNNDRDYTNTQLDSGEAAGKRPVGDSGNDAISTRNVGDDSGVTLNLEEDRVVYSNSRNESGNTSNAANDSGVKSGDDTNDHDDVSDKYDTASGSSVGGNCSGPLPWYDFY